MRQICTDAPLGLQHEAVDRRGGVSRRDSHPGERSPIHQLRAPAVAGIEGSAEEAADSHPGPAGRLLRTIPIVHSASGAEGLKRMLRANCSFLPWSGDAGLSGVVAPERLSRDLDVRWRRLFPCLASISYVICQQSAL